MRQAQWLMGHLYRERKYVVDRILKGKIVPWKGVLAGLLQLQGILCVDSNEDMQCFQLKLNYLPRRSFAEAVVSSLMQFLSRTPFNFKSAAFLAARLLWSDVDDNNLHLSRLVGILPADLAATLSTADKAYLLVPDEDRIHQLNVKISVATEGYLHSYANAIFDLLHQPCFEVWDDRAAVVLQTQT